MNQRKLRSGALFLVLFGALLFAPPLVLVFNLRTRLFGIPAEMIYLFAVWLALVAATARLARHLQPDAGETGKPPAEP